MTTHFEFDGLVFDGKEICSTRTQPDVYLVWVDGYDRIGELAANYRTLWDTTGKYLGRVKFWSVRTSPAYETPAHRFRDARNALAAFCNGLTDNDREVSRRGTLQHYYYD